MDQPREIPEEVVKSFNTWLKHWKLQRKEDMKPVLKWDSLNGYYWFVWHDVYYGIEMNGYLHT